MRVSGPGGPRSEEYEPAGSRRSGRSAPERWQGRQADVAGARHDAEAGERIAHLAGGADRRPGGVDTGQAQDSFHDLLPAVGVGRIGAKLDLPRFVDAALGLGDIERELQTAQLVDQTGLLGVDAGEDAAARRGVEAIALELARLADLAR